MATEQPTTPRRREHSAYYVWKGMTQRCHNPTNPSFPNYGGRGIVVCPEWRHDFKRFARDMGPRPPGSSIERKDNDGPYAPENCVWATKHAQGANKRNNRLCTYRGETRHLNEWARTYHIGPNTLRYRLVTLGWPIEEALTTTIGPDNSKPHHRLITYQGETAYVMEWARRFGLTDGCLTYRLNHGWSIERALTTPVVQHNRRLGRRAK